LADRTHGPSTRSIHAALGEGGTVMRPVDRSVIARFDTAARFARVMAGEEEGYLYGRIGSNPTVDAAAGAIAGLEGAEAGLLTASGMAAIHAAVVALLPARGRLVTSSALYGNTLSLFRDHLGPREATRVDLVDVRDLDAVERACADGVDVLYAETIANPGTTVADLPALARIAQAAGGRLVVDNTIATPLLCRPLEHGAAVVVHSATKFLNGHHDVLAGVVCGGADEIARVQAVLVDTGGIAAPDAAWLLARGLMTLSLRLDRQLANTQALAERLRATPGIRAVPYPGLPGHPDHALAERLLGGRPGAVLPFEVQGGRLAGEQVMDRVRLIERATSIGGIVSGISHPASTSHRQLTDEELERTGIPGGLVRLAVGCEDLDDLVDDLEQAIRGAG
jgi:cystathionine beta-lyase/cystathionine gamma-synthase